MEYLKQPKIKVDVKIHIEGEDPQDFSLFLESVSRLHEGPQRLMEFLNSDIQYIPAIHKQSDMMKFVNKRKILWSAMKILPEMLEADENRIKGFIRKIGVSVEGFEIKGEVEVMLPPERSRVTDFINSVDTFFEVIDGEKVYVCNKDQIGSIYEIREPQQ